MKNRIIWIPIVLLLGFLLGGLTYYFLSKSKPFQSFYPPKTPKQIEETARAFSDIVKVVSPAVVNISSTKTVNRQSGSFDDFFDFFNPPQDSKGKRWKEQSLGSGVVVSPDGLIVTNNHVIEQSDEIRVILYDKRSFKAKVIGADPKTDIAIIRIDAKNLQTIPWSDSDKLQVGEFVLAIGNPFGLNHTVTMGIISAVGRADVGISDYEDFIQTDAAINPGNSGGPLVNTKGELIGINTAIFSKTGGYQGIGFAVPSNMVRMVIDQLLKEGKVTRGWLGVTIQELSPELAQKFGLSSTEGALISDVTRGGPAHKAGIVRGDIILRYGGKKIKDVSTLRNLVAQTKVGSEVELLIWRKGKEYSTKVRIIEMPSEGLEMTSGTRKSSDDTDSILSGIAVIDISPAIAKQLGILPDDKGVVVMRVEPGSAAEIAGIKEGDLIQEIDRKAINNLNDFNKVVSKTRGDKRVLLLINRGGKRFYVTIPS
ncbi:MAG: DegQ family serine endoprotease [Thermodesulfovibrionales bacterium]|nr:DegQ family serine endoprotease [Thermodesulfovibrionales bacterium]